MGRIYTVIIYCSAIGFVESVVIFVVLPFTITKAIITKGSKLPWES